MSFQVTLEQSSFVSQGQEETAAGTVARTSTGTFVWGLCVDGVPRTVLSLAVDGSAGESAIAITKRAQSELAAQLRGWLAAARK